MDDFASLINDIHDDIIDKDLNVESLFINAIHIVNEESSINLKILNTKKEILDDIIDKDEDEETITFKYKRKKPPNEDQNPSNEQQTPSNEEQPSQEQQDTTQCDTIITQPEIDFKEEDEDKNSDEGVYKEDFKPEVTDEDKTELCHKLYKLIAMHCHPDKNDTPIFNKYFVKSKDAYEMKNLLILLYIYYKVSLSYKNITEDDLFVIEREIELKKGELDMKKNNILYMWSSLSDEMKKKYKENLKKQNSNIF